jgi:predicted NBD/HSP70 family sugar kinase
LHIFDPEVVILGGQIAEAGEALFEPLRTDVYDRTKRMLGRPVPLIPAQVGDRSGIVGAASLAICAIRATA